MKKLIVIYLPESVCCNTTIRQIEEVTNELHVELEKLDLNESFELANNHGVISLPAVIYDDKLIFSGDQSKEFIQEKIANLLNN
jgi:predicted DsbA family dithiol-disulfide isomerase